MGAGDGGGGGGAGGVGIRRVAGSVGGAHTIEIGGRGAQADVRVADGGGARERDLGEGGAVRRALDLDAGLGGRGVRPGKIDPGAAGCRGREVVGSGGWWWRWWRWWRWRTAGS